MNRVGHQLQAMQLDDQAQEEQGAAVLRILLQHDSARRELRVVSRLLCCSKELASAVVEHCTGQLDLDDTAFHQALDVSSRQAISWLRKHARLAQALNLSTDKALLEPVMAAGPQNLRLQSLSADTGTALPLLEQLPASFLTHMLLRVTDAPRLGGARYAAQVSAALGRLTALRSLVLFNECDLYLPGMSSLSNLTRLVYRGELFVPQHVPGQLLELTLLTFRHVLSGPGAPSVLDLRHLTALTSLARLIWSRETCCRPACCGWRRTADEQQLPTPVGIACTARPGQAVLSRTMLRQPSLLLVVAASDDDDLHRSVQPLLPLQQLQHLHLALHGTDITTPQLLGMSRLTSLDISYTSSAHGFDHDPATSAVAPAGAAAWPLLPLKQLRLLGGASLATGVCQALAQATGLTSLCLHGCTLPCGPPQLAAVLKSLSGLQELQLQRLFFPEQSEDVSQLVQAIGSLKQLRRLHVQSVAQFAALACGGMLAPLSAVTELKLVECDLCDGFAFVFPRLPALRSLDLSCNQRLTDAGLSAIVPQVQQLTRLALHRTGVTVAGMLHVTSLTRLQLLVHESRAVARD